MGGRVVDNISCCIKYIGGEVNEVVNRIDGLHFVEEEAIDLGWKW